MKASGLEPYAYLRHLFTKLPKATTVESIEALLPRNLGKDQISLKGDSSFRDNHILFPRRRSR